MNVNKLAAALGIIVSIVSIVYMVLRIMQDRRYAPSKKM